MAKSFQKKGRDLGEEEKEEKRKERREKDIVMLYITTTNSINDPWSTEDSTLEIFINTIQYKDNTWRIQ